VLRPPLKWAGGKRWQVPELHSIWAPHAQRRLVEPFCGGLAVTLGLRPARALLNDANPHLINFYRQLQEGLRVDFPMGNDETLFYRHRERFNAILAAGEGTDREAAALFYYLNRTGYNGLCRFNRSGAFNVPFGQYTRITYVRDFAPYREVLRGWTFMSGDVEAVPLEREDFVYADPPYDVQFTHYSRDRFRWPDQQRTAVWLARHRGPVVLVNQATDRIEKLYRRLGYKVRFLTAPRRISRTGDRTPAREIMATRNL
jgi:DNA adenine methylase